MSAVMTHQAQTDTDPNNSSLVIKPHQDRKQKQFGRRGHNKTGNKKKNGGEEAVAPKITEARVALPTERPPSAAFACNATKLREQRLKEDGEIPLKGDLMRGIGENHQRGFNATMNRSNTPKRAKISSTHHWTTEIVTNRVPHQVRCPEEEEVRDIPKALVKIEHRSQLESSDLREAIAQVDA
jgi:hypothetical protein